MYQLTRILPDDTIHTHDPVASLIETRTVITDALVDADIKPRIARRFALYLTRQDLGTEVRHDPTTWRFRIDEVKDSP